MNASARRAGLLLHPTALPGPHGIGDLGAEAHRFVDLLAAAGQSYWQVLPLGPTGYGDSPYQSLSSHAGNPLLLSLGRLVDEGWLRPEEVAPATVLPTDRVDFGRLVPLKLGLLRQAAERFLAGAGPADRDAVAAFRATHASWLEPYALFAALKEHHDLREWRSWPGPLATREPAALAAARQDFAQPIERAVVVQFWFDRQWTALREYARRQGVQFIGDVPIFASLDSADVWSAREWFDLLPDGHPRVVAGVPPDYFSPTGQRWGNPLYRWDRLAADGYRWWIDRLKRVLSLVDLVRIDHFRGFAACWEIPGEAPTAENGRWIPGPGAAFFHALHAALGPLPILAEDLGVITPDVERLRDDFGLPGMRILQFAFGNDPKADDYKPDRHAENSVAYTGTHDNDTTVGWWRSEAGAGSTRSAAEIEAERRTVLAHTGTDGREIHWDLIRLAYGSPARLAIVPVQDVLGLGSEARFNTPGTSSGNWQWRLAPGSWSGVHTDRLRHLAAASGRVPGPS